MSVRGGPERTVGHTAQRVLAVFMVVCLAKLPSDIYQQVYQINIAYTPSPQSNAAILIDPLGCDNQTQDSDKCLEGYLWEKAMIWICAVSFSPSSVLSFYQCCATTFLPITRNIQTTTCSVYEYIFSWWIHRDLPWSEEYEYIIALTIQCHFVKKVRYTYDIVTNSRDSHKMLKC